MEMGARLRGSWILVAYNVAGCLGERDEESSAYRKERIKNVCMIWRYWGAIARRTGLKIKK
jgi:hypothetical protein